MQRGILLFVLYFAWLKRFFVCIESSPRSTVARRIDWHILRRGAAQRLRISHDNLNLGSCLCFVDLELFEEREGGEEGFLLAGAVKMSSMKPRSLGHRSRDR